MVANEAWPRPPSRSLEPAPPAIASVNGVRSCAEALEQGERERAALTENAVALARECLKEAITLEDAQIGRAMIASPRRKRIATI